jgi:sugar/nucleoside kinase (ribokinase family)
VLYAARTLARIGADAHVGASCAAEDRADLLPALEAFGLPVHWHESSVTSAYTFDYDGDRRSMRQDAVGDRWTTADALEAVADAEWVHVGALVRTDFPKDTLERLAAGGRRLLLDAQGLVRTPDIGPLRTDGDIGDVLRHVTVLKLSDEEAETIVGSAEPARLHVLDVPEIILTLGSRGSVVVTTDRIEHIVARKVLGPVDPTGAGDTFSAAYLAARATGSAPRDAAGAAAIAVAAFLAGE